MADKKHTQDPLDLEEAVSASEAFIIKYKNPFLIGIAAIVIVVVGFLGYKNFISEPRENKATEALFKGEQYFNASNYEVALNGDSIGYEGFLKVADEFSGTESGNLANAYAGICYAQLGEYENALKYLDKFSADDQLISPAILGTMGNCYAKLGNLDKAVSLLKEAANEADNNSLSPVFLQQAGEILLSQGKGEEAAKVFTTIKEKYFRSIQSMEVEKFIEKANLLK